MSSRRAALYLQIPAEYCRSFGGLRWAQYGEAVEFLEGPGAGRTFAFDAEIALFLEGLQTNENCVLGFGLVLHLLYLIGLGDRAMRLGKGPGRCLERITEPFRALGYPLRNAGALCGWLCRGAPHEADPPELTVVLEILTGGSWVPQMVLSHRTLGAMDPVEEPGLGSAEFEALVRAAADALSIEEIRHWLRHGRGPAGRDVERLVPIRPPSLTAAVSDLERRPRLAGLGRLVSRLESALYLPPRRLARSELQGGGYADVTTRGAPEQILPIQFALDGEEFIRRFAERELLYFHREEPRQPTTEELVLLIDQGVRTWGDVRLVLAGAALALARQAERKRVAIKLAATSNDGELVDPAQIGPRSLSALLEASDLSPHPGHVLHHLLCSPAETRRDVVLLTHPRSLGEPEVAAAARSLTAGDTVRLFAVSVDSGGQVELAELRQGLPIVLGRSRINLAGDGSDAAPAPQPAQRPAYLPWKGDVEPIGFPFQCGVFDPLDGHLARIWRVDESRSFDFDETGERIMVVEQPATLFTCRIDGTGAENLPLPLVDGVMTLVRTVIGVGGGFVLVGHDHDHRFLAHYDFATRSCRMHRVHDVDPLLSWVYYRDLHTVAARPSKAGQPPVAIDLGSTGAQAATTSRATRAAERAALGASCFPAIVTQMRTSGSDPGVDPSGRVVRLDSDSGALYYPHGSGGEKSLTPLSDGSPALKGGRLVRADLGGDVLAVLVVGASVPGLYFISVSRAAVIGIFTPGDDSVLKTFALSRDGRMFARLLGDRQLEIRDVPGDRPPVLVTTKEAVRINSASLGTSCLLVREANGGERGVRARCLIRWDQGRLDVVRHEVYSVFAQLGGIVAHATSIPPGKLDRRYHPVRFIRMVEHGGLLILIDRYNHLVVLRGNGAPVCTLFVSGTEVAAWMPDGTCWGSRRLIGGESRPGAAERIAAALRSAEGVEGKSS